MVSIRSIVNELYINGEEKHNHSHGFYIREPFNGHMLCYNDFHQKYNM